MSVSSLLLFRLPSSTVTDPPTLHQYFSSDNLTMRVLICPDTHSGNFGIPEIPSEFMLISVSSSQHHHHIDRSAKRFSCSARLVLFHPESLSQHQPFFQAYSMHEDHPQKKKRWGLLKRSNPNHNLSDESGSRTESGSEV